MSDALIGQKLGQYEIRMLLGKGGMSTVYLAYQPSMDRVVAIKVLPREFLHDETFLTRFQREVRTIAKLEHLHILPIYDVGEVDGVPFYVMRYLSGGTLADLIDSKLPDMQTILRITGQIAGALDYAHERGIIHRDLKPSNVLLDNSGNAYLADFGIAHFQAEVSATDGSQVVGTPSYIAPEIVRQGEEITHSVDLYALGAITYEMFTGDPPYIADDPTARLMAHVLEPVPSVRDFDPNISPAVDAVIQRCLAKFPAERYASASEFVRELARAAEAGMPTLELPPVMDDGGPTVVASSAATEDTQPVTPVEPAPPPGYAPYYGPPPGYRPRYEQEEEDRPRRFRYGGCLVILGVILALLAGMVVSAFALTEGDPLSLMNVLTPIFTREPEDGASEQEAGGEPLTGSDAAEFEGGEPIETPEPGDEAAAPPQTGSSTRLAFTSNRDGDYEIYTIGVDGSDLQQLTDNDTYDFDPDWSPDGTQIVYVTTIGGYAEIMVMDADGGNPRQITDNREIKDTDPAWSPLGDRIAFSSDRDGDFDIYTMRPDGSDVQQVTNGEFDELNPSWSPDGSQLVFYVQDPENLGMTDLYVVDAAGGQPRRLTENDVLDQWPDWSPDGTLVAFTSAQGQDVGRRAIFALDLTTGATRQLTDGAGRDDDPVWSPDGQFIAFDSDRDGDGMFDVFVLNVATGEIHRVTDEDGNDVAPAWQPGR